MKKYGVQPGFSMKMKVRQPGRPPVEFLVEDITEAKVSPDKFVLPKDYRRVQGGGQIPTRPNP